VYKFCENIDKFVNFTFCGQKTYIFDLKSIKKTLKNMAFCDKIKHGLLYINVENEVKMLRQELKKMSRSELLEMLIDQTNENEALRKQLREAQSQLVNRNLVCENAGSIAEAALQLNGVFEAAQEACDQYTANIRARYSEIEERCRLLEEETEEKCQKMIEEAERKADEHVKAANEKIEQLMNQSAMPKGILADFNNG